MNVAAYGLSDAGRRWWIRVMEELMEAGCKTLVGNEAFVYLLKDNVLHGVMTIHVDDFQLGGDLVFE